MSKFTDAQNDLVWKIARGECSRKQVSVELQKIERTFPDEEFSTYVPSRKEKPWDLNYLKELEELFYCGANSRELIEYMSEVSEEVYRAKRMRKVLLCTLVAVAGIAVIVVFVKMLLGD